MPRRFRRLRTSILCLAAAGIGIAAATAAQAPSRAAPVWSYKVVARYPHDPGAFTQGLIFRDGFLYESTGLNGRSTVRKVKLDTGEVVQRASLPASVFGEGLTDRQTERGRQLLVLTWTSRAGYILDMGSFATAGTFSYPGEGWGLTRSQDTVYLSDGSAQIRLLDPKTLKERGRIEVREGGRPVEQLNELEWVKGEIYANVWQTDRIVRIDPKSGRVLGWIDLSGLLSRHGSGGSGGRGADVLNGIAYDAARDRLFVTGKWWPDLFEIKPVPPAGGKR
ncbi:glutaminyl-peptide cyclotransferase [Lysobacter antibioticus]|uniref:glutaminyl-peptide cyclotransferase n=1 Tax=Lysobacter antibioticus TaxID=84531 RepID=UPI0003464185|nr:glutaminyl-peptide cyclotransferase [Lysobacter antibioticus]